jgi:ribonuclease HII
LICEHFADKNYPVVSAASVVAKVIRDRRIGNLCASFGEMGSGYCHDKKTLNFLENWYDMKGGFPAFVRKTWFTACRIRDDKMQRKLPI